MSNPSIFQDENAKFQVQNGSGEYISAAAALTDQSVIGRGIYIPLWRDFKWERIARVERDGDFISIYHLTTTDTPDNKRDGNVSQELTISRVVESKLTFQDGDQILISKKEIAAPKSRRHGKIVTFIDEELQD